MSNKSLLTTAALTVLIVSAFLGLTGCESIKRSAKSFSSEMSSGLNREVTVYDSVGNILFQQQGKFDLEYEEGGSRLLYDDDEGLRHQIYLGSGTIIVNELPGTESASTDNSE